MKLSVCFVIFLMWLVSIFGHLIKQQHYLDNVHKLQCLSAM